MIAATICSGIGAPEMAMPHWQWSFQSEIEAAPRAILKHRHRAQDARSVRADGPALWGDFTTIRVRHMRRLNVTLPEWIIAGTPCQAFSIAGLRQSMADDRGNLTLEFVRLVHALRRSGSLRGFTWENVPGVLSTRDNAFGCFLAAVVGADAPLLPVDRQWGPMPHFDARSHNVHRTYGWKHIRWPSVGMVSGPWARVAWRVLDAQYFGLAQRRKRVFVVADFGNGADPAAVLFEPRRMSGDFAKGGEKRKIAPTIPSRSTAGGGLGTDFDCDGGLIEVCGALNTANGKTRPGDTLQCAYSGHVIPCGIGDDAETARSLTASHTATGRLDPNETTFVAHSFSIMPMNSNTDYKARSTDIAQPLMAGGPVGGNQGGDFVVQPMGVRYGDYRDRLPNEDANDYWARMNEVEGVIPPAIAFQTFGDGAAYETGDITAPLRTGTDSSASIVAFDMRGREGGAQFEGPHDTANIRAASGGASRSFVAGAGVRRLLYTECCALQGFPRDYFDGVMLRGKQMADGPIYKCLGNSMAVPVLAWILERVERFMPLTETQPKPPRQPA